ncbi:MULTISPECIES: SDR family NAD(P)-dependent oxidoreductase [Bacillus amyloliquefaciens group]|uniref:SDR family NAD(P)-dependent oxidoreductase n=1 Tax=Bacillus amyloliquefaciens group TaxID=1938374 RepID=UPI00141A49DE|nr:MULTISPECIES: SDR family NAD(P)-dependent oxidoreductase [Bacillus amyloliquefaciens group]
MNAKEQEVYQFLRSSLVKELNIEEELIQADIPFVEMGLDSIIGVMWLRKINSHFGISVPATKVYSYPTLGEFHQYMLSQMESAKEPSVVHHNDSENQLVTPIESRDDQDREGLEVSSNLMEKNDTVSDASLLSKIVSELKETLSKELDIDPDMVYEDTPFTELGLDSIYGVIWIRKLNGLFQLSLSITKVYSYPTITLFAAYLIQEYGDLIGRYYTEEMKTSTNDTQSDLSRRIEPPVHIQGTVPLNEQNEVAADTKVAISKQSQNDMHDNEHTECQKDDITKEAQGSQTCDIAIVGMSGKFPQAETLDEFWNNILGGKDCVTEIPPSRWSIDDYYDPEPNVPGKTYSKWMGVLENADKFDPLFFNISPIEAEYIDPQQRLMLQESWRCIEDAGYDPSSLSGTNCGVYIGCSQNDYGNDLDLTDLNSHQNLGNNNAVLASRISYYLNLRGPCLSIDTSCSSSLVAIANACDNLLLKNIDVALSGGVWVIPGPNLHVAMSQLGALSSDGRCYAFDSRANGFVPAEGVGVIMLKRIEDARRDRDHIYAVIKGWGVNQDGKSNGITAPNADAQATLQRSIYEKFNINPENIQLVETHGTGTALGDPVEIDALTESFNSYTDKRHFCALTSVKSNIGHTACAAGVAGVIKTALAIKNKELPPTANFTSLNPHLDLSESPFFVNDSRRKWSQKEGVRHAAVSSFGYSGTNAHVVMSEELDTEEPHPSNPSYLIALSARNRKQLEVQVKNILSFIEQRPDISITNVSYTLMIGRKQFRNRLAVIVKDLSELTIELTKWLEGDQSNRVETGNGDPTSLTEAHPEWKTFHNSARECHMITSETLYNNAISLIGKLYLQGYMLPFEQLFNHEKYRRISLPTYPFSEQSFWLSHKARESKKNQEYEESKLHPLIHRNTLTGDKLCFHSTFTANDFFMRDHKVNETMIVPAVVYIEMAREAIQRIISGTYDKKLKQSVETQLRLQNVIWLQPGTLTENEISLDVRIMRKSSNRLEYEIVGAGAKEQEVIYSQGVGSLISQTPSRVDISDLSNIYTEHVLSAQQFYEMYKNIGLNYGQSHQSVIELSMGQDEASIPGVLAKLEIPRSDDIQDNGFVLHPSIMDGALQATMALGFASHRDIEFDGKARLPFSFESLDIYQSTPNQAYAWIRRSAGGVQNDAFQNLDITICDVRGNICVDIKGFLTREYEVSGQRQDNVSFIAPVWTSSDLPMNQQYTLDKQNVSHRVVLIGSVHQGMLESIKHALPPTIELELLQFDGDTRSERYESVIQKMISGIKEFGEIESTRKKLLQVVVLEDESNTNWVFNGISGFLKTLSMEHPSIRTQCIGWFDPFDSQVFKNLIFSLVQQQVRDLKYVGNTVYFKNYKKVLDDERKVHSSVLRDGGTFLITGGLGGLGSIFAHYIASNIVHGTVILSGRSTRDHRAEEMLDSLREKGVKAEYYPCDISQLDSVERLFTHIESNYGELAGIIHAAGTLHDDLIMNKSNDTTHKVLSPKIAGIENLDDASRSHRLDFFVSFSSNVSELGNPGQSVYAAANGFMDAYVSWRAELVNSGQRFGKTLSINWPLWAQGGMRVDQHIEDQIRAQGLIPLGTREGVEAFRKALGSEFNQLCVFSGNLSKVMEALNNYSTLTMETKSDSITVQPANENRFMNEKQLLQQIQVALINLMTEQLKVQPDDIDLNVEFSEYGYDSISLTIFANMINQKYNISLTPTTFFEYPTLGSFAEYLCNEHGATLAVQEDFSQNMSEVTHDDIEPEEIETFVDSSLSETHQTEGQVSDHSDKDDLTSKKRQRVAIVGMSGSFPQADDLDQFWDNLLNGVDCITEIPLNRWDWRELYGNPKSAEGKTNVKWGGFMNRIDLFDPLFFGISPREAESMDPQQRLLMTHVWRAIEDAGYAPSSLSGSNTAVLIGTAPSGYGNLLVKARQQGESYAATGISGSVGPNRISYLLNLHGPSEPIETACSSSLVAIHRATELIRSGEVNMAIVGGVNTIVSPDLHISYSRAGMLSEYGRCKTFSDQANGYARGEGAGILILKSLEQAEVDGDHIYGVILGSEENHGGRANSLTAPNPNAQAELIKAAHRKSGIDPSTVTYIEAHGTGTELGDPVELNALKKAYKDLHEERGSQPGTVPVCGIGSVKSNIGHLELAAGVAGVIKTVLQMKHKTLVKSLHTETLNPYIKLDQSPFYILQENRSWEVPQGTNGKAVPRRAGISSFGFGGVNTHLVLEEYEKDVQSEKEEIKTHNGHSGYPIVLSARSEKQLIKISRNLLDFIQKNGLTNEVLESIAFTLQVGRDPMEERLATVVYDMKDLKKKLESICEDVPNYASWYKGRVKLAGVELSKYNSDQDRLDAVAEWVATKRYEPILNLWVQGFHFDWRRIHTDNQKPERISLPTYPFEEQSYWVKGSISPMGNLYEDSTVVANNETRIHPMIHQNHSSREEVAYSSHFKGNEFFLSDHIVNGQATMPGVAYLEMAREASVRSSGVTQFREVSLSRLIWLKPAVVSNNSLELWTRIQSVNNDELGFEIYEKTSDENLVYCQGNARLIDSTTRNTPKLDVEKLLKSYNLQHVTREEVYNTYDQLGIDYGSSSRAVAGIHCGLDDRGFPQAIARLSCPENVRNTLSEFVLHPSVMDSALQATLGMNLRFASEKQSQQGVSVPFALDVAHIYYPIPAEAYAWTRYSGGSEPTHAVRKLDITVCDVEGRICAELKGLSSRVLKVDEDSRNQLDSESIAVSVAPDNNLGCSFQETVVRYFQKQIAEALSLPVERLDVDSQMERYGMDSMMAMDLTDHFEKTFGPLSKTIFFEVQTVRGLAEYFINEHGDRLNLILDVTDSPSVNEEYRDDSHEKEAISSSFMKVEETSESSTRISDKTRGGEHDIAIIGIGGRYPQADTLEEYWENLKSGKDCISEIPSNRWDYNEYYSENKDADGKSNSKWGGFINGVDHFDPLFFNISPREAEYMDPQERLFLQSVYEAIEDAGYTRESIATSFPRKGEINHGNRAIGVYVGVMYQEYQLYGAQAQSKGVPIALSGNSSAIANRVSYYFDFHGPSMTVDTMCSSSLTSIHLACESIKSGQCEVAIAGGVNVSVHPNKYLMLSQGKFASSKGHCGSFGKGGDGYVPGEGVGALVLKPLSQAITDGDHIYGVVKGTAINHGGKTNGFSVPNPNAQSDVIINALEASEIHAGDISYIESHGTGTSLGDPIEIAGLMKAYRNFDREVIPGSCSIGSVKSNIGHCESAAGVAAVTKVLLQMKHKMIVPSLHSSTLNPNIDFSKTPFKVQQSLENWECPKRIINGKEVVLPRIAGISSFGAGGSNAHVVIQEYTMPDNEDETMNNSDPVVIVLSAATKKQLTRQAEKLRNFLLKENAIDLVSVAYTLQVGREEMVERLAMVTMSVDQLIANLDSFIQNPNLEGKWSKGSVSFDSGNLKKLLAYAQPNEVITNWIKQGKHNKIADFWVNGGTFDWKNLYEGERKPKRISLPTYSFARERYWGVDQSVLNGKMWANSSDITHPLIHKNASNAFQVSFLSTFTGTEFFLKDHNVQESPTLPGVVHLEMGLEAAKRALDVNVFSETDQEMLRRVQLRDILWLRPVMMLGEPLTLQTKVKAISQNKAEFSIYSEATDEEELLYSQGVVLVDDVTDARKVNLNELMNQCNGGRFTKDEVYTEFTRRGFSYGSGFKGIDELHLGTDENGLKVVFARMSIPPELVGKMQDYTLMPSLLDGALQASIGLAISSSENANSDSSLVVPFAIESMDVIRTIPETAYAWIRYNSNSHSADTIQKLDISVLDSEGRICVDITGFSSRQVRRDVEKDSDVEILSAEWKMVPEAQEPAESFEEHQDVERVAIVIGNIDDEMKHKMELQLAERISMKYVSLLDDSLDVQYRSVSKQLFEIIQELLRISKNRTVFTQVVTLANVGTASECFTGLAGLLKTAEQENPRFKAQYIHSIQNNELSKFVEILDYNAARPSEQDIRYDKGTRKIKKYQSVDIDSTETVPWGDKGVHIITGGLGGLGMVFAQEIAKSTSDSTIVLLGRSKPGVEAQQRINEIRSLGCAIEFIQADITDRDLVNRVISEIRQAYGGLNGIIHSAGMTKDNFIVRKTTDEFDTVLAPKVTGLINLDEASCNEPLDYFVCFSSVTGALGNVGQADYAVANGFMDGFAEYRNRLVDQGSRKGKTVSINWPLWRQGGMQVDVSTLSKLKSLGITPLETEDGLIAFNHCIASSKPNVLVYSGDRSVSEQTTEQTVGSNDISDAMESAVASTTEDNIHLRERSIKYFKEQISKGLKISVDRLNIDTPLEQYGMDSIVAMGIISQLEQSFGALSKTLFFEVHTIRELSNHFVEEHRSTLYKLFDIKAKTLDSGSLAPAIKPDNEKPLPSTMIDVKEEKSAIPRQANPSDVAIIGVVGRYPKTRNMTEFWNNLLNGKDCISEIPEERWDVNDYFDPDKDAVGTTYCKWGGFIDDVDQFDPQFFNITPHDAKYMDPQQRLSLEIVWELLEESGITQSKIKNNYDRRVGVYMGSMYQMYQANESDAVGHALTSVSSYSLIANRLSYYFGFEGPSVAVDNMCSSSAMAIHLACKALMQGEAKLAIAGGVNLSIHPRKYVALSQSQMLASSKESRSFCAGDGYLPSEGVGIVLLKPLRDAIRDGDNIMAVVKSSSSMHSGQANGFMAPNFKTQVKVIEDCLERAGLEPHDIGYIEAAANGAALGDTVEMNALGQVFKNINQPVPIGSVKSNIGHPEAASGIAQLTKVLLQLENRTIPPIVQVGQINPNLDLENLPFRLTKKLETWSEASRGEQNYPNTSPRRALINSIGAGGSYVSMIIEEYQGSKIASKSETEFEPQLVVLSAKDDAALYRMAENALHYLDENKDVFLPDLAYTLQLCRNELPYRLAFCVSSVETVKNCLASFLEARQSQDWLNQTFFKGNAETDFAPLGTLVSGRRGEELIRGLINDRDLERLAALWVKGCPIDWNGLHQQSVRKVIPFPTYPFERSRYWHSVMHSSRTSQRMSSASVEKTSKKVESSTSNFRTYLVEFFSEYACMENDQIPLDKDLHALGIDSLGWLRLQRQVEKDYDIELKSTELLELMTINALAKRLEDKISPRTSKESIHEDVNLDPLEDLVETSNSDVSVVSNEHHVNEIEDKKKMLEAFKSGKIGLEEIKKKIRQVRSLANE